MRPFPSIPRERSSSRSGAALLLSLLILLVLVAIVIQINVGTGTVARVARNDIGLTTMDLAVESALLQVDDQLAMDAGTGAAPATGAAPSAEAPPAAEPGADAGAAAAGGGQGQAVDSRRDEWARPQRTTINDIRLRILVQDEDSKINVLNMLNPDEKEAQAAFDRVVRCLDLCREGTLADIRESTAEQMARAMLEYMTDRRSSKVPRAKLLSDDPQNEDQGLPLSLKEFAVLVPFEESHFRDFRDEEGVIVHSIGSFLTVWSSVSTVGEVGRSGGGSSTPTSGAAPGGTGPNANQNPTGGSGTGSGGGTKATATPGGNQGSSGSAGGGSTTGSSTGAAGAAGGAASAAGGAGSGGAASGTGGYAVNVNTAPVAVLKSLFDDRDLHPRFWDRVVEYRNLEEEKSDEEETEEAEAQLDEYGELMIERQIFDTVGELSEVDGYQDLPGEIQSRLNQILATQSRVFSIFVIARRSTAAEGDMAEGFESPEDLRAREEAGDSLLRVVRCVVWRREGEGGVEVAPIVRWEVLDYVPFEVQDYPDEER